MLLGFVDFLDSREKAIVFWLVVVLALLLPKPDVHSSFGQVVRAFASWKLISLFGSAAAYSALVVLGLRALGLWHFSSFKETLYWFFGTGVILVGTSASAVQDSEYVPKLLRQALRLTILVEFVVALYVFPLLLELVLIPVVTVVVLMNVLAESDPRYVQIRKLLNGFITGLGFVLLVIVSIRALDDPVRLFTRDNGEELLIAPVMTLALLPLLYGWALVSGYEQLFFRVTFFSEKERPFPRGARRAIFRACGLRLGRLTRFSKAFTGRLHGLQTQDDLSALVAEFNESERRRPGQQS